MTVLRSSRVAGALVGAVVGDALGAPFAGGPPGRFGARFPAPARGARTEMCGGGPQGLAPGEVTAQMREALSRARRVEDVVVAVSGDDAVLPGLLRTALDGGDPVAAAGSRGAVPVLDRALDALVQGRTVEDVLRRAVDLGGDTSAVAAVAGALAGAVHGVAAVPARWASAVHGRLPGRGPGAPERPVRLAELQELAAALDGRALVPHEDGALARLGPVEVADGVWAANLAGARGSDRDFAVVSLCRVGEPFGHEVQRLVHLLDTEHNSGLDAVLADVLDDVAALRAEGRRVLVHCHGGASRTGLVLRAWLRRTRGLSPAEATAAVAARWPHLGTWNDSFTAALERMTP